MEVTPHIHFIPNPTTGPAGTHGANVFLVGEKERVIIDTGHADEAAVAGKLEYLKGLGEPKITRILLTHRHIDHVGGAPKIKEATGASIILHKLEVYKENPHAPVLTPDEWVEGGEVFRLDSLELEVVHTPGHTPGHCCFYLRDEGVLFAGDHIAGAGTTAIIPPFGDMKQYLDALHHLLSFRARLICPGHGPIVKDPETKIRELIQHRMDREEQVLSCLRRGLRTVDAMVQDIYPELEKRLLQAAKGQVTAHLNKLESEDRVRVILVAEDKKEYELTRS